jgi:HTH-type transcriptional regulator/antitoxin HigA
MTAELIPARVAPPSRIIERELEALGWTQAKLATVMGRPVQAVNEIMAGTKRITAQTALDLAEALDSSPEFWMNLENNYQLFLARKDSVAAEKRKQIARRRRLYSIAPIQLMVRRGWIKGAKSVDELAQQVSAFLGIASPDEVAVPVASFRLGGHGEPEAGAQTAWTKRVEQLARRQQAGVFDRERLIAGVPCLLACSEKAEDIGRVPSVLADLGVRFVTVPHVPRTYIDGAVVALAGGPAVGLTLRYDRVDSFWFTLLHELAHLALGHMDTLVETLYDNDGSPITEPEAVASRMASDWLLPSAAYGEFVDANQPRFSRSAIGHMAAEQHRHPSIVLGRLQFDHLVPYPNLRALHESASPFLSAWTDQPD